MRNSGAFVAGSQPATSTFVWATVTSVSPLRIRVAGETTALPITPTTCVTGLALGSVVRVEISPDGQAIIIGLMGDGTWATYSPTASAESGTLTSVATYGRFTRIGKTVVASMRVDIFDKGSGSGNIRLSLPVTMASTITRPIGTGREVALSGAMQQIVPVTDTMVVFQAYNGSTQLVNGYVLAGTYTYEVA